MRYSIARESHPVRLCDLVTMCCVVGRENFNAVAHEAVKHKNAIMITACRHMHSACLRADLKGKAKKRLWRQASARACLYSEAAPDEEASRPDRGGGGA